MKNNTSTKLSEEGLKFLRRYKVNRIKAGTDEDLISYADCVDLIASYFKMNNDNYLELVKMEVKKNGIK